MDELFGQDNLENLSIADLREYIQYLQEVHLEVFQKVMESNRRIKNMEFVLGEQDKLIDTLQAQLLEYEDTCNVLAENTTRPSRAGRSGTETKTREKDILAPKV